MIVSDALDMAGASAGIGIPAAAVLALAAGADLLCLGRASEPHLDAVQAAIVAAVRRGELTADRLHDAAVRVRALAEQRSALGIGLGPGSGVGLPAGGEDRLSSARIATAFEVTPSAAATIARRPEWTVVRLDAEPNIAVGLGDWGPFSAGAIGGAAGSAEAGRVFTGWRRIDAHADRAGELYGDGPVLAVGRDIHRHPHARAVVDGLRARGCAVVAVEMGWPADDRHYADVATFGASAAVGAALVGLLTGTLPAVSEQPSTPSTENSARHRTDPVGEAA